MKKLLAILTVLIALTSCNDFSHFITTETWHSSERLPFNYKIEEHSDSSFMLLDQNQMRELKYISPSNEFLMDFYEDGTVKFKQLITYHTPDSSTILNDTIRGYHKLDSLHLIQIGSHYCDKKELKLTFPDTSGTFIISNNWDHRISGADKHLILDDTLRFDTEFYGY